MSYRCLADFLEDLGRIGDLVRVQVEVDPALELSDVTLRVAHSRGPALLFGAVKGHDMAVLTNLLATESRICRGLGVASLDEATARIEQLLAPSATEGWLDRLKGGSHPALASMSPRCVKAAACQQIVRLASDVDLGRLPLLRTSPSQDGRSVAAATVFTAEPDSHRPVAGRFDLQQVDRTRLAVGWAAHDDHARLLRDYGLRNQKMPLAVVLGGDPAFLLAAAAPLPLGANVCGVAGVLREKPLDVVACRSIDLEVPAEAEVVIEGYCDPAHPPLTLGSLCTPLGCCGLPRMAPVMHVTAVTHRPNPIYTAMVPGPPPHEACTVNRAMQRVFLPLVRLTMPELVDYDLPEFAAARHWAAVSIRKTYPGQGRRAAHAAWGLRPMMFAKMLIVVDEEVDVHDPQEVLAAVAVNMDAACDVFSGEGPADPFDPAAAVGTVGHRLAIDATRKLAGEPGPGGSDSEAVGRTMVRDDVDERVSRRWAEYGLGEMP